MDKIITIGVYGFSQERFFQVLQDAHVEVFCDLRMRRGMRGSDYAFVNSQRLQTTLKTIGIQYVHIKELAPAQEIREKQKSEDARLGIGKRDRLELGSVFKKEYERTCLSNFDAEGFMDLIGRATRIPALFCVEREPEACHRSLVAAFLAERLHTQIEHLQA